MRKGAIFNLDSNVQVKRDYKDPQPDFLFGCSPQKFGYLDDVNQNHIRPQSDFLQVMYGAQNWVMEFACKTSKQRVALFRLTPYHLHDYNLHSRPPLPRLH